MSPILVKNGQVVADIPDQIGIYETPLGPIKVDYHLDGIVLEGDALRGKPGRDTESGRREIYMDRKKGVGAVQLRGGERLDVMIHDPTSEDRDWIRRNHEKYLDPYWWFWRGQDRPSGRLMIDKVNKHLEKSKGYRLEWLIRRNKEG